MSDLTYKPSDFLHDVCVVGTGRVGLPLALSLIDAGMDVVGLDTDQDLRANVNAGVMPFKEPGYEETIKTRKFKVSGSAEQISQAETIIITVGTPLHTHIETDLRQIRSVLETLSEHLRAGQLLCLRSTVAPGTTDFVARWLEKHTDLSIGEELDLVFCPERIAEGKAREELATLPQIIGARHVRAAERAERVFRRLTSKFFHTDFTSAELVKLFNNINRYVHFALANQFAIIADTFDVDIYAILTMANHDYPRNRIASPGLTAGTCLRKDFGMINEWTPYPDMLLSAWKMNEYIPAFLVQHMKKRTPLHNKRVGILGYSFKADTDDTRDSLAPKLCRYIERETPERIVVSDEHLPRPRFTAEGESVENRPEEDVLFGSDVIFVATNHSSYKRSLNRIRSRSPETWVADLWNVGATNKIFYQAAQIEPWIGDEQ